MGQFFIWLSGADRSILDQCTTMGRSERKRFANLGALVLVPATLGLLSMMYAISTLTQDVRVYVGAGVLWFFIVATIDRYILSTTHKSRVQKGTGRTVGIVGRLLLALFIGVAVSHPVILLLFHGSISEELADTLKAREDSIIAVADQQKAALPPLPPSASESAAAQELHQKNELSACLGQLQTAEQSGVQISSPCGYSSPNVSCGPRCEVIGEQKEQVDREIAALRAQIAQEENLLRTDRQKAEDDRNAQIQQIDEKAAAQIATVRSKFSVDYPARIDALSRIEERQPAIAVAKYFIFLLFIVIDVLPVMLKLATPYGEYELVRDRLLIEAGSRETVAGRMIQEDEETQLEIQRTQRGIQTMTTAWTDYLDHYANGNAQFHETTDRIQAATNGDGDADVQEIQRINNSMWKNWGHRLRQILEPK
jgi:hypothetical protein